MNRRRLEESATAAALVLLVVMLVGGTFGIADGIFGWDLLSKELEMVAGVPPISRTANLV